MQAYIKLNNSILDCGLTVNELKVAVCLYAAAFNGIVQIKQVTIAEKCGFKQEKTVANIICRLQRKGIIERVVRPYKRNGNLGTYIYKLKKVVSRGYFKVKRYILNKLSAVQLRMYLFICRAVTKKNEMWNSYNDIAKALGIGRNKAVATIKELVQMGVVRLFKVLKKDGSYSDNHYSLSDEYKQFEQPAEKEDKKISELPATKFGYIYRYTISVQLQGNYTCSALCCQQKFLFLSGVVP